MAVIYNDDCSSLTGWTDDDSGSGASTQVTFDSRNTFKMDSGGSGSSSATIHRILGDVSLPFSLEITLYNDDLEPTGDDNFILLFYYNNDGKCIQLMWEETGVHSLLSYSNVLICAGTIEDTWQKWKFYIKSVVDAIVTLDIYLNDILQESDKTIDLLDFPVFSGLRLSQQGNFSINKITYIDSILIEDPTIGSLYRVDAMKALIRTQLKEPSTAILSSAIILQAINDAYKEVASRAFCIEHEDTATTVAGDRLVPFSGHRVVEVKYGTRGLLKILPTIAGYANISGNSPQYWFQWGQYIVIEPVPDAAYSLTLSVSDYPTAELTLDTEYSTSLPDEFHPCIVDFACYVLSLRLCRWDQAAKYYNLYIQNLKKRKKDYIDRKAEKRAIHATIRKAA